MEGITSPFVEAGSYSGWCWLEGASRSQLRIAEGSRLRGNLRGDNWHFLQ